MEHSELITEMAYIEKLSTQERLKLARRRRMQQLKKCSQRDKDYIYSKKEKTALNEAQKKQCKNAKNVLFANNVMILEAAARNDIDEVRELLEMRINPDSTNEDGLTALHQCCIDDSEEMMRLLVSYGANVNAQDSEKWTPLHAAATCGHLHLAKFLISQGANLLAVNADGNMPYDICEDDATLDFIEGEMAGRGVTQQLIDDTRGTVERQMLQDLKNLKEAGKSLVFRDEQGATPLHIASANGYIQVVEYLLSQNVPTEVQDNDDWSPLHAAACWGHLDVMELLVQHGANLQARTKNQETPYDICEDAEFRERIIQLLTEQETKRFSDQNRRIRRVRSNTRTQSIRRTSVREKTLTAKKEAQEEARIRLQLEPQLCKDKVALPDLCQGNECPSSASFPNELSISDYNSKTSDINVRNIILIKELENERKWTTEDLTIGRCLPKSPLEKFTGESTITINGKKEFGSVKKPAPPVPSEAVAEQSHFKGTCRGSELPESQESSPSALIQKNCNRDSGNKIDIHVTVTVNPFSPGTLADLKKQRALSRASQNSFTVTGGGSSLFSLNSAPIDSEPSTLPISLPSLETVSRNSLVGCANYCVPPSPSQSPRRFYGTPSDIVGKNASWVCCSLM